jgi:hypothetical protein
MMQYKLSSRQKTTSRHIACVQADVCELLTALNGS